MRGAGLIAIAGLSLCALPASGFGPKDKGERALLHKAASRGLAVSSPDQRHLIEVSATGQVWLDGVPVRCGPGRVLGRPVWRRDSRAVALLQLAPEGPRLLVLPGLEGERPLSWYLPFVERPRHVFWISSQRIGVGAAALVPSVVVSWTTTAYAY